MESAYYFCSNPAHRQNDRQITVADNQQHNLCPGGGNNNVVYVPKRNNVMLCTADNASIRGGCAFTVHCTRMNRGTDQCCVVSTRRGWAQCFIVILGDRIKCVSMAAFRRSPSLWLHAGSLKASSCHQFFTCTSGWSNEHG